MKNRMKFTLIEVIITSVLLTMIVLISLSVTTDSMKRWTRVENINDHLSQLREIEQVLGNSMANAIPFVWRDDENFSESVGTFTGEPDRVAFCYLHQLNNLEEGAIRFIGLVLEEDEFVAYYKSKPWIDFEGDLTADDVTRAVLATGIKNISFQYVVSEYETGEEELIWEEEWDDDDEKRFDIPLAMRIDITWEDGDITESFLYRTAGNSRYQRWGDWKYDTIKGGTSGGGKDDGITPPGGPGGGGPPVAPGQ